MLPFDPDTADQIGRGRAWDVLLVVAAGGAVGGAARYLLNQWWGGGPWVTFAENVAGSLILGGLMVLLLEGLPPSRYARPFLGVGVLGGFTTFSTYIADAHDLLAQGGGVATVYLFGTVAAGLLACWAGMTLVRWVLR